MGRTEKGMPLGVVDEVLILRESVRACGQYQEQADAESFFIHAVSPFLYAAADASPR